ncbi:MAG TPA: hypothetical protein VLG08_02190 [Casimicrobiaceae bacterium]|jgi:hypothetical protein|nr:hypothetical protein [Casimicrobiaceae bacterium]
MPIDAHLHCTGRERADEVLRAFDEANVDVGVLINGVPPDDSQFRFPCRRCAC